MPGLLSEYELNQIQYVSMADYIRRMDRLENIEDKMAFTTRYLLTYGNGQRDVSLAEAIHIAKVKIAEGSAEARENQIMIPDEAVDPNLSDEEDARNRQFMIDPVFYLQTEANRLIIKEANNMESPEAQRRIENYQTMSTVLLNGLNGSLSADVSELDIQPTSRDVQARLKAKFGGEREFKKAYSDTKPGVLSKMFGTSSVAYANLEQTYKAFNNPDHVLYGDMNSLDKAATEYLKHCFPRWNPKNGLISQGAINRLSGTKKARAMFSLNILKATAEQRKTEPVYENIIAANIQQRADMEADVNEEEFQQNLLNDVNEEADLNSSEAERDYHKNFEDVPEVEDEELVN